MSTAYDYKERYLSKDLLNGLLTTPDWAREQLEKLGIKTIDNLRHKTEDQVRSVLMPPGLKIGDVEYDSQVDRAVNAVKGDLREHDCCLA